MFSQKSLHEVKDFIFTPVYWSPGCRDAMMCKDGLLAWQSLNNGTPKVSVKPLGNSVSSLIYPVLQIKEQLWVQIADGSMLILRFSRDLNWQLV